MSISGRLSAAALVGWLAATGALAGCMQDPVTPASAPADGPVVQACPDKPPALDRPKPTVSHPIDATSLKGPHTAVITDDHVRPVGVDAQPQLPVTVESCDGSTAVVDDVSRILAVDLNGSLADVVFGLGLGDKVVGRDRSTDFPEAADLPLVTPSAHDLSAEAILALDPTVVLTDRSIGPPEVLDQLRDVGIPVLFFDDASDLSRLSGRVQAVAGALGVAAAGTALADRISDEMAASLREVPVTDPPLRIAFLYVRGSAGVYLLAGPGSGADQLIEYLGGVDVGTDLGLEQPFTPLTSEAMIEAAPDVLLVMTDGLKSVGGVDELLSMPGIEQTPAADKRRVVDMADDALLSFGTRTPQVVDALAKALYAPHAS